MTATAAVRDEGVIAALHEEYGRRLLSFAVRLTYGDRHWAEDVVQETLLRAWRHAATLRVGEAGSLWPWLATVARRIVLTDRARRGRRPTEVSDEPLRFQPTADKVEPMLDSLVIADALAALTASHREALIETYYKGHTVQQAAANLGLPLGTVKSRVYYGLRALRLALDERGIVS